MALVLISFWWDLLIILAILSYMLYGKVARLFSHWERLGMPGPYPKLLAVLLTRSKHFGMCYHDLYNQYKQRPYLGVYQMTQPILMVNDLEMIKRIMVKDFSHFTDRTVAINLKSSPLAGHLFNLKGEEWKNLRAKLTPTFTSSRMRQMFDVLEDCGQEMMGYLDNCKEDTMEIKEILAKFNTDVIGRCAFGIECNSFKDPNSKFRLMGQKIFSGLSTRRKIMMLLFRVFPKLLKSLNFKIFDNEVNDFFINLVKETVEYREKNKIERNDFLQLLIKLKNNELDNENQGMKDNNESPEDGTKLTLHQLAAQVFVFFLAGFETSSTTGSFALYELALNPDVQETLAKEIEDCLEKHGGRFTYDSLAELTYLSNVIDETLRKYPPLPVLFRICTRDYTIPDTDIKITKDTQVMMSIYGIQRDPAIYPNPDKFDPERFNPENKEARDKFAHLPFGEGPRVCIGNRFGLMQSKLGLAMIIHKYEVSVCDKTTIPMEYDKNVLLLACKEGIWLKLKKRSK